MVSCRIVRGGRGDGRDSFVVHVIAGQAVVSEMITREYRSVRMTRSRRARDFTKSR